MHLNDCITYMTPGTEAIYIYLSFNKARDNPFICDLYCKQVLLIYLGYINCVKPNLKCWLHTAFCR